MPASEPERATAAHGDLVGRKHMLHSLLSTKLNVPPARQLLVSRPHLLQQLNQGLAGRLILVSAPAGFGKTTLLAEWAAQSPMPVAWISLDEGDNDLERFLSYLFSAVETVDPGIGVGQLGLAMRQSSQPLPLKSLLTTLVNDIAESRRPLVIILDDYHFIHAGDVHDVLAFLIGYLPENARLVIASRADLPLPLARLRARKQLTELRADDLRFTAEEVSIFLAHIMGLALSADDVEELDSRTEGWIAGLQLAALSLQRHERPGELIAGVDGTHRYILDYLAEEVLAAEPADVQAFLLQSSILKRLSGSLCAAVTGEPGASQLLAQLEAQNLFVFALDEQRQWYRYHHLFGEFLRGQLETRHPGVIEELHRRAIDWYRAEGVISEAIEHALAIDDFDQAAELVEVEGRRLLVNGEISTIARWAEVLPNEVIQRRPKLELTLAWTKLMRDPVAFWQQRPDRIEALAKMLTGGDGNILRALEAGESGSASQILLAELAILKGFFVRLSGELAQTIQLFEAAIEALPDSEPFLRGFATAGLGSVYIRMGDVRRAERAFARAEVDSRAAESTFGLVICIAMQAAMQAEQANFVGATRTYERALAVLDDQGTRSMPMAGQALTGLADVLREQNRIEEGLKYADQGIALGQRTADTDALREGYVIQARLLLDQGRGEAADRALRSAMHEARLSQSQECLRFVRAWQARQDLAAGRPAVPRQWAADLGLGAGGPDALQATSVETLTYARLLLARRRGEAAIVYLEPVLAAAEADGRLRTMIEALAVMALSYQATGASDEALQTIARALLAAEPGGSVRVFVDLGPPMAALLREAGAKGHSPSYVQRLLEAFGAGGLSPGSYEPLSTRELEVLQLLATGLSNPQIAAELVIAVSTVKTHVNRIYAKLDVNNRAQAIVKARDAGLID
jgi:LuxR family maltose regulon positive regulatory protein